MTTVRQYDGDSAIVRWRQCENARVRRRECDNTMTTVRQYDGENARTRWRECDDTMVTVRYYYRIVAIVLSHCRHRIVARCHRIIALSSTYSRTLVIVFSHSHHRFLALSSSYYRIVAIVLSRSRILALWILMCNYDGPNGIP